MLGSGGAGKSTLARRLGDLLNIEVKHLDKFYWRFLDLELLARVET